MKDGQVSLAAQEVARVRRELQRPGDGGPGAADEQRFLATFGGAPPFLPRSTLAARTRFFDECVVAAQTEKVPQIVLVGAGYDGRALRFRSPGITFYELDHPATQADKLARLSSLGMDVADIRFGSIDFSTGDAGLALAMLGHQVELRTLFLCEGVAAYLTQSVLRRLLRLLRARAAPGTVLAVSFAVATDDPDYEAHRAVFDRRLARMGESPRTHLARGDVDRLLNDEGWRPTDSLNPDEAEYGSGSSGSLFVRAIPLT